MQPLLYFLLFALPFTILLVLIWREQQSMQRVGNTFIKLMQKFESWQMLR